MLEGMTVSELIEQLQRFDKSAQVRVNVKEKSITIQDVGRRERAGCVQPQIYLNERMFDD